MLFQTMDDKSECVGFYRNGNLYFDVEEFPADLTKTWSYAPYLKNLEDIEYASLYLQGEQISEVVPEYLMDDWKDATGKLDSHVRSLKIAKVDMNENCIYDLTPKRFLVEWCEVKNKITEYVLTKVERPQRYDFLLEVCKMLHDISSKKLNLDKRILQVLKVPNGQKDRLLAASPYIRYDQFGTKTGRLSTKKNSFPILTLNRDFRGLIKPNNDTFVELDFNGAEVRCLLGLLGVKQPMDDVHDFHRLNVFGTHFTRKQAKEFFFAWLYGSRAAEIKKNAKSLEKFYDKKKIMTDFWDGQTVVTPLGKRIENVSQHHALNYIVQSTTAELTLLQALKINHLLEKRSEKSFICAIIHDSIIIDLDKRDRHLLPVIKKIMQNTKFGTFRINVAEGKNLGKMKDIHRG